MTEQCLCRLLSQRRPDAIPQLHIYFTVRTNTSTRSASILAAGWCRVPKSIRHTELRVVTPSEYHSRHRAASGQANEYYSLRAPASGQYSRVACCECFCEYFREYFCEYLC
jgi:hypothetical protein